MIYFIHESESRSVVSDSLRPHGLHSAWNSPGQNTGVGGLSVLQLNFPTQGSNRCLLSCRRILYQLSRQGRPSCVQQYVRVSPISSPLVTVNWFCSASVSQSSSFVPLMKSTRFGRAGASLLRRFLSVAESSRVSARSSGTRA